MAQKQMPWDGDTALQRSPRAALHQPWRMASHWNAPLKVRLVNLLIEGSDSRGIDVAYLVRGDQAEILDLHQQ